MTESLTRSIQDYLKRIYELSEEGVAASTTELAARLNVAPASVTGMLQKLAAARPPLVIYKKRQGVTLTKAGLRAALEVIRHHRLLETWLVQTLGYTWDEVHEEAERLEHVISKDLESRIAAALGHPTRDPHGDPIPTREGKMDRAEGMPVTAWQPDRPARIVHLEDEPALAYEQILAAGLRLGQDIRILERTPQRVVLSDGENEYRLAPAVASNISVAPLPESELLKREAIPLTELAHDRRAEIVTLDDAVQGFTRRRFLDLGLTPGTTIYPELQNFFGDPRGYRVRGTLIALRKDQAAQIWVKPV